MNWLILSFYINHQNVNIWIEKLVASIFFHQHFRQFFDLLISNLDKQMIKLIIN